MSETLIRNVCKQCGGAFEFHTELVGSETPCPHCSKNVVLSNPFQTQADSISTPNIPPDEKAETLWWPTSLIGSALVSLLAGWNLIQNLAFISTALMRENYVYLRSVATDLVVALSLICVSVAVFKGLFILRRWPRSDDLNLPMIGSWLKRNPGFMRNQLLCVVLAGCYSIYSLHSELSKERQSLVEYAAKVEELRSSAAYLESQTYKENAVAEVLIQGLSGNMHGAEAVVERTKNSYQSLANDTQELSKQVQSSKNVISFLNSSVNGAIVFTLLAGGLGMYFHTLALRRLSTPSK